jgi:1-acyl-sn-glycerol-3-phosphate acyltransferase
MEGLHWHYDTATDMGLSFIDRLKEFPPEPDPLVCAARLTAAVATRAALSIYNRFAIVGREHLPREGSFVLVANHASHLDTVLLLAALPLWSLQRAYPLAARDYFCANRLRLALTAIIANIILFDRDATGIQRLKLCQRMLTEPGNVLIMFPEGTRSGNGRLGRFRRGVGLLLAGAPYPVVPCYIEGTVRALPKGTLIPRPARLRLIIGEARAYERVEPDDHGALHICADLHDAVLALARETRTHKAPPNSKEVYP